MRRHANGGGISYFIHAATSPERPPLARPLSRGDAPSSPLTMKTPGWIPRLVAAHSHEQSPGIRRIGCAPSLFISAHPHLDHRDKGTTSTSDRPSAQTLALRD